MSERDAGVRLQAQELAQQLVESLGAELVGVYVHGSVALGTFNPAVSDLDVIAVTRRRTNVDEKHMVIEILARTSGHPAPIEFHMLSESDFRPWRHPTPFDFHYSDIWSDASRSDLPDALARQREADPDLAAHVTVARTHGLTLHGPPAREVFPEVPWSDYVDSLLGDLQWIRQTEQPEPEYRVLSPARIWATLATQDVHSKESGAVWALKWVQPDFRSLLAAALARYRGKTEEFAADADTLERFAAYIEGEVHTIVKQT